MKEELLRRILSSYKGRKRDLIPILQAVQANFGRLPEEAMLRIARFIGIPESEVYSVASFYTQFRLTPLGRKHVTACRGTACHIRGAPHILREIEKAIGIKEGEVTSDLEYSLETVACIGCCALAPCIRLNRDVYGEMTPEKVKELFPASDEGEQDVQ
ncbi:MAG: NADH-quinone oxidoreductase subunit NuoE [Actinomycetota bacterium]|nr:NADH-quinone oxidoreductase subunit NuoE [Actinomycetota bacterium]